MFWKLKVQSWGALGNPAPLDHIHIKLPLLLPPLLCVTFLTFMSFLIWHFNSTYFSMPHNGDRFHNPLCVTPGWPLCICPLLLVSMYYVKHLHTRLRRVVHASNPNTWKQRQADLCEFKASLVHKVSSRTGSKVTEKPRLKKQKQTNKK